MVRNAELLERFDWSATPLGDRSGWPAEMQAVIRMALASDFPIATAWGDDYTQIYNDAYNAIYGDKHPGSFGAPARESWAEIWPFLGPALDQVRSARRALDFKDTLLTLARHGEPEECYFDFCYSPVIDAEGRILGVVSIAADKTTDVVFRRRQMIADLGSEPDEDVDFHALAMRLRDLLTVNDMDCVAAILYSVDPITGNPDGELWTIRADADAAMRKRPVAARAAKSGGIRVVGRPTPHAHPDWSPRACVVPLTARNGRLLGILLMIPHRLVPIERSLMEFGRALSARFHTVLHAAEARREAMGQALEELAGREAMHRFLFENIWDGAVYCSTSGEPDDDEIVLAANPGACRILGYAEDEIIGMSRAAFFFPDDRDVRRALKERARDRFFMGDLNFRTKDGRSVPVELTSTLVPLRSGEMRSLTILRDMSRRMALEQERSERARLEMLATLTGGIAHDFNNLLTVIFGNVEALVEALPSGTTERRLADGTMLAAERAARLTSQLLSYSQRQTLDARPLDLNAFLHEVRPLLTASLGEPSRLEMKLDPDCPHCLADPAQLTTALLNLVVNARDAMPGGGLLTISTAPVDPEGLADTNDGHALKPGRLVRLRVRDNGTGMAPDIRRRAFEPFFTTKEIGSGSGLGLSMAQGFMRQLGGDIRLSSEVGRGTSIDLVFRAASAAPETVGADAPDRSAEGQVVLHVEDNALVRENTRRMLADLGFAPVSVRNAREALSYVEAGRPTDIVLTDLVMPGGVSGLQLAEELRKRDGDLPIVITTGHDPRAALVDRENRPFEVLRKPYSRAELKAILLRNLRSM